MGNHMLASYRFSRSTLNNRGESRMYHRETWLSERVVNHSGHICSSCLREIAVGETYAATHCFTRLCTNDYGELSKALAEAAVTIDGIGCVNVIYTTYQGVTIHDFKGCAMIISDTDTGKTSSETGPKRVRAWMRPWSWPVGRDFHHIQQCNDSGDVMQSLSVNYPVLILAIVALFLFGMVYGCAVRKLAEVSGQGQTAYTVVVGIGVQDAQEKDLFK